MKNGTKTLSIAAIIALVSAAGVTIAQTSEVPNSSSPGATTSAQPATDGSSTQSATDPSAAPAGSMGSTTDSSATPAAAPATTDSAPTVDTSSSPAPSSDQPAARADRN